MKQLVVFPDVQSAGAGVLRDALADRSEPFTDGVKVGTRLPTERSPEAPHLPYVMCRLDSSTPHSSMANSRGVLRVTVWHQDEDQAHDLAQLARGLLVVHGGAVFRSVRPGMGPLSAVDDVSTVDLSTFTVTVNVRPNVLA